MIYISLRILGEQFFKVALEYAEKYANEKAYDKKELGSKLNNSKSIEEFKEVYEEYFRDEIIIDVKKS